MTMRLDRLVTLQERVVTRGNFGSEREEWVDLDTVWARVRQTGVSEQYINSSNREQANRNAIMRIRYRDDVGETMRAVYQDHAWDIIGIDEVDYRRYLDLTVQTEVGGQSFLPRHYIIMAGLSDDDVPEGAELTIGHESARITFDPFTDKHVLIGREVSEPALTSVVFDDDVTRENQLVGFDLYATPVVRGQVSFNVLVSEHLLTFAETKILEVA